MCVFVVSRPRASLVTHADNREMIRRALQWGQDGWLRWLLDPGPIRSATKHSGQLESNATSQLLAEEPLVINSPALCLHLGCSPRFPKLFLVARI